jgi:putative tryptophan/tyrosine transport system substrate-binding protein
MTRREFISRLAAATMWPLSARAQQPRLMRRIGVLTSSDEANPEAQSLVTAFREELGWTEGRNIKIDVRWTKADVCREVLTDGSICSY